MLIWQWVLEQICTKMVNIYIIPVISIIISLYVHHAFASVAIFNTSAELHETLMNRYVKDDIPTMTSSTPLSVTVAFHLTSIVNLNEIEGEMVTVGYLTATWVDTRLTWNPLEYSGIGSIMMSSTLIWTPNIVLGNPSRKITNFNADIARVRILYNGTIVMMPGDVFHTRCDLNIYRYPFDNQICHLSFLSWPYLANEVVLVIPKYGITTPFFQENGGWFLRDSSTETYVKNLVSVAEFGLHLDRRSEFFVVNVILPIVSMCFVACLVFLIPQEGGERISYTITVLLSFAVFMTLVSDNIPKISAPMSLLCYYLFGLFFGSVLIMLNVIFNSRLFHKDENEPIPTVFTRIALLVTCKRKCVVSKSKAKIHVLSMEDMKIADSDHHATTENNESVTQPKCNHLNDSLTWMDVAKSFDKLCFIVYVLYFFILSCGIVLYVQCVDS